MKALLRLFTGSDPAVLEVRMPPLEAFERVIERTNVPNTSGERFELFRDEE